MQNISRHIHSCRFLRLMFTPLVVPLRFSRPQFFVAKVPGWSLGGDDCHTAYTQRQSWTPNESSVCNFLLRTVSHLFFAIHELRWAMINNCGFHWFNINEEFSNHWHSLNILQPFINNSLTFVNHSLVTFFSHSFTIPSPFSHPGGAAMLIASMPAPAYAGGMFPGHGKPTWTVGVVEKPKVEPKVSEIMVLDFASSF